MSTPFGVDLGNNNTVIAIARNRGIDIVVNEVSNRATPTVVGFGIKNRSIGESVLKILKLKRNFSLLN
ncbi:unnamed protein product [[Candida] boidinii]|nr:unnamed protein product [[Candida] boidinii]